MIGPFFTTKAHLSSDEKFAETIATMGSTTDNGAERDVTALADLDEFQRFVDQQH